MQTKPSNWPSIRYFCDISPGTGYNNAARGTIYALEQLGYTPQTLRAAAAIMGDPMSFDEPLGDWFSGYMRSPCDNDRLNIVHLNPGAVDGYHTVLGGRYNVAYTAWETDRLPISRYSTNDGQQRTVAESLSRFDEIWVPTEHVKEVFVGSGVTKPIYVIRHHLQKEVLEAPVTPLTRDQVMFLYVGAWTPRKDPLSLLHAWFQTKWRITDPVRLFLHSVPASRDATTLSNHSLHVNEQLYAVQNALPDTLRYDGPAYASWTSPRPMSWLIELYKQASIFVTASRGEGACLPAIEALAMGRPVIAGGPWAEELHRTCGSVHLVKTNVVPVTPSAECAGYELGQKWWALDVDDLTERLESVGNMLRGGHISVEDTQAVVAVTRRAHGEDVVVALKKRLDAIAEVLQ